MKFNLAYRFLRAKAFEGAFDGGRFEVWSAPEPVNPDDTKTGVKINTITPVFWDIASSSNATLTSPLTDPSNEATGKPNFVLIYSADGLKCVLLTAKMRNDASDTRQNVEVIFDDPNDANATQLFANRALNVNNITLIEFAGF